MGRMALGFLTVLIAVLQIIVIQARTVIVAEASPSHVTEFLHGMMTGGRSVLNH